MCCKHRLCMKEWQSCSDTAFHFKAISSVSKLHWGQGSQMKAGNHWEIREYRTFIQQEISSLCKDSQDRPLQSPFLSPFGAMHCVVSNKWEHKLIRKLFPEVKDWLRSCFIVDNLMSFWHCCKRYFNRCWKLVVIQHKYITNTNSALSPDVQLVTTTCA